MKTLKTERDIYKILTGEFSTKKKNKKCLWQNFFKIFIDVVLSYGSCKFDIFLIDSLDTTLQKYIFNISPWLTMATIEKK